MKKSILLIFLGAIALHGLAQHPSVRMDSKGTVKSVEYWNVEAESVPKSANEFFENTLNVRATDSFEKMPHRSTKKMIEA